ncbi:methyltransferase [Maledivibacter halophilus]|uniref:16S RNA G1207 methylase RsmC n=1 Tax=Maledivibacter halophilus TaxID=36842 RepID=A0A1T5LZD6_9FIRM|nr:methyltransferase [Maledivibacter halophilus]SKC81225.1 16S RNA G1207 methylase RsmC [Maledivibacter halophilus]
MLNKKDCSPNYFYKMVQNYKEAQLLFAAIELDIFTYLGEFKDYKAVALETGYNERNLKFFLNSLVAIGLIEKKGDIYRNTPIVDRYLNKEREVYLGGYIVFREKMTQLLNVVERVKKGPIDYVVKNNKGVEVYDFYKLAKLSIKEMYTGRVQSLLEISKSLFIKDKALKILDLGGGSGTLAIEFIKNYPDSTGVIFEHPSVSRLPKELVKEMEFEDRIKVLSGDFTIDDIGKDYDFIIASGVLDFAKDSLSHMVKKLYDALNVSGYLYIVSHDVNEEHTAPKQSIVGWLSSHLDGLDILLDKNSITNALETGGFVEIERDNIQGIMDNLQGEIYIKG